MPPHHVLSPSPGQPGPRRRIVAAAAAVLLATVLVVAASANVDRATGEPAGDQDTRALPEGPPVPGPAPDPGTPDPSAAARPDPTGSELPLTPEQVAVTVDGFLAWAVVHLPTGMMVASGNAGETSTTESMIKVWLVSDYLRRVSEAGGEPSDRDLRDARLAIRDSHNGTAERLYAAGGRDAVVERLISICGLRHTSIQPGAEGFWSLTEISAADAARMGSCIADGRAAGPEWTDWVLNEMRNVRGTSDPADQRPEEGFEGGRWGLIDGLPPALAGDAAIKNGWTRQGSTGSWHVGCLAITAELSIAVLMRYPAERPLAYGADACATVAEQLVPDTAEMTPAAH